MPRQRTRLHYKKLVDKIINWLNADIDECQYTSKNHEQDVLWKFWVVRGDMLH